MDHPNQREELRDDHPHTHRPRTCPRAIRRVQDALPGITYAEAQWIAALDLAVRRTMDEPR